LIAYLRGVLISKQPHSVVIDTGGVGYIASIPISTYLRIGEERETVELFIYTHLTDSSLSLFGFSTTGERDLFLKLIAISGIGPKMALNVLSGMGPTELEEAVRQNDVARISLIPGIGKKTALRIAMELQEKIEKKEKLLDVKSSQEREDIISALVNLGFRRKEVEAVADAALKSLGASAGFDKLLRESLKKLAKV